MPMTLRSRSRYAVHSGRAVLSLVLAVLLAVTAVLSASVAVAGTLQIRDESALLTPADRVQLQNSARAYPFDVRVVITSALPSRAAFDRYIHHQVTEPDLMVIGIDPVHRATSVHFGRGMRIARVHFRTIEDAGDPFFRRGDWRGGIDAIVRRAAEFVGTAPASGDRSEDARSWRQSVTPFIVLGLLLLGGVLVAVIVFSRRSREAYGHGSVPDPYRDNAVPPFGPNYGPGGSGGMGYGPPPPQGPGALGAGLIGAGLGGLAGYALGRAAAEAEHHHEHHVHSDSDVAETVSSDDNNYDAGGSTSGWDDWDSGSNDGGDWGGSDGGDW